MKIVPVAPFINRPFELDVRLNPAAYFTPANKSSPSASVSRRCDLADFIIYVMTLLRGLIELADSEKNMLNPAAKPLNPIRYSQYVAADSQRCLIQRLIS